MVALCSLCRSKRDTSKHLFLHNFPTRTPDRLKLWKRNIYQAYQHVPNFKLDIKYQTKICSRHFASSDFQLVGEGRVMLSLNAIPTLFPDVHRYVAPRIYYDPRGDSTDVDVDSEAEIKVEDSSSEVENKQMNKEIKERIVPKRPQISTESLLISNVRALAEADPVPERDQTDGNEMPTIGIIVRAHDLEVVELSRRKATCRLCTDQMETYKLISPKALDEKDQTDLDFLFRVYFKLDVKRLPDNSICRSCLQTCQNIINLKSKVNHSS